MSEYFVLQIEWADDDARRTYVERLGPMIEKNGGDYIVASRDYRVVEGKWRPGLFLIIKFPSREAFSAWYDSEEYRSVREYRLAHSVSDAIVVEGD